jgi:GT2 family glycosyltransferase
VDNGSKDNTVALIEEMRMERGDCIIPILLDRNTGTTYSRNLALKQANGKYICIMDSDVVLQGGTLAGLISILDSESSAGLVAPRLVYPDGRWQKSTDDFPTIFTKLRRSLWLRKIEKKESEKKCPEGLVPVDYAISALWVMRREILEKVGLLDENIFYAPEDVDYCLRIWTAGYQVLYARQICSIHDAQEISRGFRINSATIKHMQGLLYYFRKHRYCFRRPRKAAAQKRNAA